jgi:poly-gamma-glutamate capsule biosynthesis protein CapA/YwtB (metallophosphatase superfamily)
VTNANEISFVHLGNTYIPKALSSHKGEGFLRVLELLRKSDVAVANLECTIHDGTDWPAFGGGMGWAGTYMPMPPSMIDELKNVGINAVYCANNHTADFGEGGILTAVKYLRQKDMAYSGIGASLTEATEPCYIETQGGTVAIVSIADWGPRLLMELPFPWPAGYMPSDELPPFVSRPGVNLVRYDVVVHVDRAAFDQLRRISEMLQWERGKIGRRTGGVRTEPLVGPSLLGYEQDTDTEFFFMGRKFVLSDEFRISTFAFQEDLDRINKSVREARRNADVVIVGMHDQSHADGVADFVRTLAHGVIDAGADLYINHGGRTRGIELHNGKAIAYGQGAGLAFSTDVTRLPSSMLQRYGLPANASAHELLDIRAKGRRETYEKGGFLPPGSPGDEPPERTILEAVFANGALDEIRLHPTGRTSDSRIPGLLQPESDASDRCLQRSADLSAPFGTKVEIRNGVGVIRVR